MSNSSNQNENNELRPSRNISIPPTIRQRQLPGNNPNRRSSRSSPTSSTISPTSSAISPTISPTSSRSSSTSRAPVRIPSSDFNLGTVSDAVLLGSRMAMMGSPPPQHPPPSTTGQSKDPGMTDLIRLTGRIYGDPNRTVRGGGRNGTIGRIININRPSIIGRQPQPGGGGGQPGGRGRGQPGGRGRGQPGGRQPGGRGRGRGRGRGQGGGTGEEKNNMI